MTFLTLAMLIVGGRNNLSGAIVGTVVITIFLELIRRGEDGTSIGSLGVSLPNESHGVAFALLTLLVLILRPNGIMGGRVS
jgi:branched-chain amino acid transport system permease protein